MAGVKKALQTTIEARPAEPAQVEEQLELLGAPVNEKVAEVRRRRKVGRPKGAINKKTAATAEYLLSRYSSPLEVLMQIATAGVEELSASLGCTKLVALQEKRLAALAVAPYLHTKMPVAVDVTNRKVVNLIIEDGDGENLATVSARDDEFHLTGAVLKKIDERKDGA